MKKLLLLLMIVPMIGFGQHTMISIDSLDFINGVSYLNNNRYDGSAFYIDEEEGKIIETYYTKGLPQIKWAYSVGSAEEYDRWFYDENGEEHDQAYGNIDAIEEEYQYTNYWENGNKKDEGTRIWGGRNYEKEINIGFRTEYYNNGIIKRVSFYEFDAEDNINRATYLCYSICFDKNGRQKECE